MMPKQLAEQWANSVWLKHTPTGRNAGLAWETTGTDTSVKSIKSSSGKRLLIHHLYILNKQMKIRGK